MQKNVYLRKHTQRKNNMQKRIKIVDFNLFGAKEVFSGFFKNGDLVKSFW